MSMSVLRAQAFAQMVSVSTPMDLFDVNVQWATTLIILECDVWVSIGSTLHNSKLLPYFSYSDYSEKISQLSWVVVGLENQSK
jgi:hypothetical protein